MAAADPQLQALFQDELDALLAQPLAPDPLAWLGDGLGGSLELPLGALPVGAVPLMPGDADLSPTQVLPTGAAQPTTSGSTAEEEDAEKARQEKLAAQKERIRAKNRRWVARGARAAGRGCRG